MRLRWRTARLMWFALPCRNISGMLIRLFPRRTPRPAAQHAPVSPISVNCRAHCLLIYVTDDRREARRARTVVRFNVRRIGYVEGQRNYHRRVDDEFNRRTPSSFPARGVACAAVAAAGASTPAQCANHAKFPRLPTHWAWLSPSFSPFIAGVPTGAVFVMWVVGQ